MWKRDNTKRGSPIKTKPRPGFDPNNMLTTLIVTWALEQLTNNMLTALIYLGSALNIKHTGTIRGGTRRSQFTHSEREVENWLAY